MKLRVMLAVLTAVLLSAPAKAATQLYSTASSALCTAYSPDGTTVVVGLADGSVRSIDVAVQQMAPQSIYTAGHAMTALAFSPSGNVVACASSGAGTIGFALRVSGRIPSSINFSMPHAVTFLSEDVVVAGNYYGDVRAWNVQSGALVVLPPTISMQERVVSLVSNVKRHILVVAGANGTVSVWDTKRWRLLKSFNAGADLDEVVLSDDGSTLYAIRELNQTVDAWNARTGKMGKSIQVPAQTRSLALVGKNAIAVGLWDQSIRLYNRKSGRAGATLNLIGSARGLAASPDGSLSIVTEQNYVAIWQP